MLGRQPFGFRRHELHQHLLWMATSTKRAHGVGGGGGRSVGDAADVRRSARGTPLVATVNSVHFWRRLLQPYVEDTQILGTRMHLQTYKRTWCGLFYKQYWLECGARLLLGVAKDYPNHAHYGRLNRHPHPECAVTVCLFHLRRRLLQSQLEDRGGERTCRSLRQVLGLRARDRNEIQSVTSRTNQIPYIHDLRLSRQTDPWSAYDLNGLDHVAR